MPTIGNAPSGEKTSSDGTEKLAISGSQWMLVSRIAEYIRTLTQTLTNKTLTAPTIADFTNAIHDHQDNDDGGTLAEAALSLTDVTTNNSSITKHGFLPRLDSDSDDAKFLSGVGTWLTPAGSGGGRTFIEEATGSTGTITLGTGGTIPQGYNILEIEYELRSTKASAVVETMQISFNNDTTDANYRYTQLNTSAGGVGYSQADGRVIDNLPAADSPANSASHGIIRIPFYKGTTFNKVANQDSGSRLDAAGTQMVKYIHTLEWESTAAITEIDLILAAGNFSGTVRLYGLA